MKAMLLGLEDEVVATFNIPRFTAVVRLPGRPRTTAQRALLDPASDGIPLDDYHYDAKETDLARLLHGPDVVVYRRSP